MVVLSRQLVLVLACVSLVAPNVCAQSTGQDAAPGAQGSTASEPRRPIDLNAKVEEVKAKLKDNPTDYKLWWNLAWCYSTLGKHDLELDCVSKALSFAPDNTKLLGRLLGWRGGIYFDLHRLEDALNDYSTGIKLNPGDPGLWSCRAETYMELGRWNQAKDDEERVVKMQPDSVPDSWKEHGKLGNIYEVLGLYADAVKELSRALELNPNVADNYSLRATCYRKLGRKDLAEQDEARARSLGSSVETAQGK